MHILILGAGYAGLRAALDLAEAKRAGELGEVTVTLVDRNDYHQVITWLHEVAAASVAPDKARIPLEQLLGAGGVAFHQATVRGIAPREQRVLLADSEALSYDRLVVALGSITAWPPIEGLREHALPMRWWDEAVRLREAVLHNFALAAEMEDEAERKRLLTLVVAGGGYTGCQLAGEMAHWVPELADHFGLSLLELTLRQIEARERLMPGWDERLADKAERILRRKGVQILLNSPLERLDAQTMTLKGKNPMPYGLLIWAGGVQAPPLLKDSGFTTGVQGRAEVDAYLRAKEYPDVFVIGDASLWMEGDKPLPGTASHALRQGEYVARMIRRQIQGKGLADYEPTNLGLMVSLGGSDGVGIALGIPLSGVTAGILKEGIESWYLSTIGAD
ncbi:MAG: NAD(P)/FAD-dependent oxidoreductase [Ardenticatenales bacterium]|nr:NAD(P)/FAD-dependent oxidoreductase [Ardenticatenales bacterium]